MKVSFEAYVCHDVEANSTVLRCKSLMYDAYRGDGTEVVIDDMRREFLWDDTHEIGVRCAIQKALERWAEQLWLPVDVF